MEKLKSEWLNAMREMRQQGYAVCVFNPDELGNADQEMVEDAMTEAGWDQIALAEPADQVSDESRSYGPWA